MGSFNPMGALWEAGGNLVDNLTGANQVRDAEEAARIQKEAAAEGRDMLSDIFQQNREDMLPWLKGGEANLNQLNALMSGGFFDPQEMDYAGMSNNPDYQFRVNQGVSAIDRGAAAKGGLRSGATDIDLMKLGQGMASGEVSNIFNRNRAGKMDLFNMLFGMSQSGQTQSGMLGNLGSTFGGNSANMLMGGANAEAAGIIGAGNARAAGSQNLLNALLMGGGMLMGASGGTPGASMAGPGNSGGLPTGPNSVGDFPMDNGGLVFA